MIAMMQSALAFGLHKHDGISTTAWKEDCIVSEKLWVPCSLACFQVLVVVPAVEGSGVHDTF